LFLYGPSGNGKSTIADRVIRAYSPWIWIPRALSVGGQIVRLFDSIHHRLAPQLDEGDSGASFDRRWVRIERPTIVVGSEMQLSSLEITTNSITGISEAPLQLGQLRRACG
jgi:hypothetical protein